MPSIDTFAANISRYLGPEQVNLVRRAYYYAEQAHDGQRRRSGEHYVTHPLAVANILAEMHMDPQSLMAAMLHDVIEDTGIPKEAIVAQFGETVADLVDGVSKLTQMDFQSKAEAQAENFQKMAMAMARDLRVILVKLADRLHNMRTLDAMPHEKRRRIARETLEIYAPIANRLGMHNTFTELEDLGFRAMHPMRSKIIGHKVRQTRGNSRDLVAKIQEALTARLIREQLPCNIEGRQKHLYSIYRKMRGKRRSFKEIMDVYAFRIVVDTVDMCYRVLGAVHNLFKPIPGRFKDYIAIPKSNGYQSLHTVLFGLQGVPIEIQIRTHEMEEMASHGIAAHWLYKAGEETVSRNTHERARRWIKGVLELQQRAGNSLEFIENVKIDLFPDEVYVFTPKGRIMELPKGSTAVDFAYAVHTDVGNRCLGCRLNRRMASLDEPLQSGQTVEIITAPGAHPSPAWLDFVVTGKARTNIRHWLKQMECSEAVEFGKRLLDKALKDVSSRLDHIPAEQITLLLAEYQLADVDTLLRDIGLGHRTAYLVARRLIKANDETSLYQDSPLAISGTEGLVVNYARCCNPIPGDSIVGRLSAGKGMVIHLDSCRNITEPHAHAGADECIPLAWARDVVGEFSVSLRVELEHQRGLIAVLASAVTDADANVEKISMDERDGRTSAVLLAISVRDRVHLARVIKQLRVIKGVQHVTRVRA